MDNDYDVNVGTGANCRACFRFESYYGSDNHDFVSNHHVVVVDVIVNVINVVKARRGGSFDGVFGRRCRNVEVLLLHSTIWRK